MTSIKNSNLLYRPSVSVWTARKKDRAESAKVNQQAGAVEGAANVHKQLLPDSAELEAVQKHAGAFRTWIYDSTLPWDDSGWRIGRADQHFDFMVKAGDKMREYDTLVEAFVDAYATAVEQAKFTLNSMFNPLDYPGVEEVRSKFCINVDVMPLPNCEDFRVVEGIDQAEVDKLCAVASNAVEQRIKSGMDEAYSRLFNVVNKLATTLQQFGDKDIKKFNDTLVWNVGDLVDILPALNIASDPKLDALAKEARKLMDYDPADLRKDDRARNAAIADARDVIKRMQETAVTKATGTAALFADMMGE